MSTPLTANQPRILPCPNCNEMIYSDVTTCRFCSAPVDSAAAEAGANLQEKVNAAVNQAKWIRNMAGVIWIFLAMSFFWNGGTLGFFALFFITPISLVYWQIRYGRLQSADPDYKKAKRDRLIALVLWLPAALIGVGVLALQAM
jgi:hypothetical protein